MKTTYLLMAKYEAPSIPLSDICEEHFGLTLPEANRLASLNKLPVPTYRVGANRNAPRHIHIEDLALLIDARREAARQSWENSKV